MREMKKVKRILRVLRQKAYNNVVTTRELDVAIMEGADVIHWQTRKNYRKLLEKLGYIKPALKDDEGNVLVWEICQA